MSCVVCGAEAVRRAVYGPAPKYCDTCRAETDRGQRAETQARYRVTESGKATATRYWQSEKGRALSQRQRIAHLADYRERTTEYGRRRRREKKDAYNAASLVNYYVKTGKIVRPDACESCGAQVRLHGHHHRGYTGAAKLDVVWLCPACHRARHGEEVMPR